MRLLYCTPAVCTSPVPQSIMSGLAVELTNSKAIAGKELSLSSWGIASLYIYHYSTVVDFSSEKYSGSTGHMNPWYQQRHFQLFSLFSL